MTLTRYVIAQPLRIALYETARIWPLYRVICGGSNSGVVISSFCVRIFGRNRTTRMRDLSYRVRFIADHSGRAV
jgi:hypothetical protein